MHFRNKIYGAVKVGNNGQVVIPAKLRKSFNIKPGYRMMVFARFDKKIINLMPEEHFNKSLKKSRLICELENKAQKIEKKMSIKNWRYEWS